MTRQNENKIMKTYLEEIMNNRAFKFFQGHVITHSHIFVSHSLLKPSPSKILVQEGSWKLFWKAETR